ncbi:glucan endo-1,3-alpha-glucosidase, glycoside hydrolase family 71 protein [Pseudohyphozyma bogoriensis]|nr:glucan endo-1,3-alpha-glucosidase, glycoside hydrolase family 71 protein [Pseudohyphozyma bogoriensis]
MHRPSGGDDLTTAPILSYMDAAKAKGNLSMLATVSAFFYVHDATDNNRVLRSDDWLLPKYYESLIGLDPQPDFIELLTWNDFGESHYLSGPRANANPSAAMLLYANETDFNHTGMLILSSYYNSWFKTGNKPTIQQETVVWWYRPHKAGATATSDALPAPTSGTDWTDDKLYAAVLLPSGTKAKNVIFTTGGTSTTVAVSAGEVNLVSTDFSTGTQSIALVDSSNNNILQGDGADISDSPPIYNYNYHCYILPEGATPESVFLDFAAAARIGGDGAGNATRQSREVREETKVGGRD